MITDTIHIPLLKPTKKTRHGFLATSKMEEKKGRFVEEGSEEWREKISKRRSDDEGRRKQAHSEGSPPSSPP